MEKSYQGKIWPPAGAGGRREGFPPVTHYGISQREEGRAANISGGKHTYLR